MAKKKHGKAHGHNKRMSTKLKQRELEALEIRNRINQRMFDLIHTLQQQRVQKENQEYKLPELMLGIVPEGEESAIAQDSACSGITAMVNRNPQFYGGFVGYAALAQMTQSSDYRAVPETTANEMTREWGKVKVLGEGANDLKDRVKAIEKCLKKMGIRGLIRKLIETEMTFGRAQLFINIKGHEGELDLPLLLDSQSITKGSLTGFKVIEPMWTTPAQYNSVDPTAPDFYNPTSWYVSGKKISSDRLITLIMRPVPDLLKPAYNFSGIPMIQLMQPYVERWQRTVDAVSDLIHAFSMTGLKTDLSDVLSGADDSSGTFFRMQLFNEFKNNLNTWLLNKDSEEFFQLNTPLTTLDTLMQKAQEQMAGPSKTPMVKLLGITPSGLNANSDGEIRVYYDYIMSLLESFIHECIEQILRIIQLHLFGEIHEEIGFEFNSLHQMTDEQRANTNKAKAETAATLVEAKIISEHEARTSIAQDESNDFTGIDADEQPTWDGLDDEAESEARNAA